MKGNVETPPQQSRLADSIYGVYDRISLALHATHYVFIYYLVVTSPSEIISLMYFFRKLEHSRQSLCTVRFGTSQKVKK
jgi:hypothetical protein